MTEFESAILMAISDYEMNKDDGFTAIQSVHKHSFEILRAARKYIVDDVDEDSIVDELYTFRPEEALEYIVKAYIRSIVKKVLNIIEKGG